MIPSKREAFFFFLNWTSRLGLVLALNLNLSWLREAVGGLTLPWLEGRIKNNSVAISREHEDPGVSPLTVREEGETCFRVDEHLALPSYAGHRELPRRDIRKGAPPSSGILHPAGLDQGCIPNKFSSGPGIQFETGSSRISLYSKYCTIRSEVKGRPAL